MELVEGRPLTDVIPRGRLPLDALLRIGIAHQRRDCRGAAARHHPSRLEARQRDGDRRRPGEGARLRSREAARPEIAAAGDDARDARPASSPAKAASSAPSPTCRRSRPRARPSIPRSDIFSLGVHAPRDGDRGAAVQGRHQRVGDLGHPQGHAEPSPTSNPKLPADLARIDPARAGEGSRAPLSDRHGSTQRARRAEAGDGQRRVRRSRRVTAVRPRHRCAGSRSPRSRCVDRGRRRGRR